jgi:hypothetical protein
MRQYLGSMSMPIELRPVRTADSLRLTADGPWARERVRWPACRRTAA